MMEATGRSVLWTVADWRCELQGSSHLLLFRGAEQIAHHVAGQPDRIVDYANVWHAAIRDVFASSASPRHT